MTDRYARRFAQLKREKRRAFIPFTLLGWPDRQSSFSIVKAMIECGASSLELGLAFSDPVADGPIIQQAASETLASGFKVRDAFELIAEIRGLDREIPIGLLVYYNMVLAQGVEQFCQRAQKAGVDGILVADLPPEAASEVVPAARACDLSTLFIVSPLTTEDRLGKIREYAGAFVYAVSRLGITGTEARYDQALKAMIARVHATVSLPVCVGFGVSTPDQARAMFALGADGVITGSRILQLVREANGAEYDQRLRAFLESMSEVCLCQR